MHQIQRQIIEVQVYGSEEGFRWQQDLERLGTGRLPQRLEAVFDQYSPKETVIIDRLELDLGSLAEGTFEEEFLKAVEKNLGQQLAQLALSSPQFGTFSAFDSFLYFLENGTLPWWSDGEVYRQFVQEAETPEGWNRWSEEQMERLTGVLRKSPFALRRLRGQFSELFLIQLTILLFQKKDPKIIAKWSLFQRILQDYRLFPNLASAKFFYGKLIENQILFPESVDDFFVKILHKTLTDSGLRAQVLVTLSAPQWESFLAELGQKFGESFSSPLPVPTRSENLLEESLQENLESKIIPAEAGEYYYITNGGLVLLAPFLTEYLKNCGVAEGNRILDPDTAVHLIQYLATGQSTTPEYELVLNKVLCGLPIQVPVVNEIQLTEAQQQEAGNVLNSVLQYWSVLKNTSQEGLQSSFLQRPAKLTKRRGFSADSDEWLLQVEQGPYDMLLSDLPWGYSPVALPWMPESIWVEWS